MPISKETRSKPHGRQVFRAGVKKVPKPANKMTHDKLVQLVDNLLHPQGRGLTSEQLNQQLLLFCINCPDPMAAMDIAIDTPPPVTAEELVERALARPFRDIASVPESELPATHPLRHMKLEH